MEAQQTRYRRKEAIFEGRGKKSVQKKNEKETGEMSISRRQDNKWHTDPQTAPLPCQWEYIEHNSSGTVPYYYRKTRLKGCYSVNLATASIEL